MKFSAPLKGRRRSHADRAFFYSPNKQKNGGKSEKLTRERSGWINLSFITESLFRLPDIPLVGFTIARLPADERHAYFQQDGARPHTLQNMLELLGPFFGKHLISLGSVSGIIWPPCSPDLNPLDYFLWSYLKNKIYRTAPTDLDELKAHIMGEIVKNSRMPEINFLILEKTFENFLRRRFRCLKEKENEVFEEN